MKNRTEYHSGGLVIQRRPLRDYMPGADRRGNPMQWWAWRWMDDTDESARDWIAGPLDTKRELMAAIERMKEAA